MCIDAVFNSITRDYLSWDFEYFFMLLNLHAPLPWGAHGCAALLSWKDPLQTIYPLRCCFVSFLIPPSAAQMAVFGLSWGISNLSVLITHVNRLGRSTPDVADKNCQKKQQQQKKLLDKLNKDQVSSLPLPTAVPESCSFILTSFATEMMLGLCRQ